MSRYTMNFGEIAYGYDHATGYFFQQFNTNDDGEELIIDEDSLFTKMSNARMIELMTQFKVNEEHIAKVAMDLPF